MWSGAVVNENSADKEVVALQTFNNMAQNDSQTQNILLPLRDGLMCVTKI
ncbi:MAG: hypothetical protein LBP96_00120 [Bacteroidales bacterium]|nr:hypothetical protein [Bacteroidales bacterium]